MTGVSLVRGILVAGLLSLASPPLLVVLAGLGWHAVSQWFVALLACGYLAYLLASSPSRVGRLSLGAVSGIVLAGTCLSGASIGSVLLLGAGLIWLTRAVLRYTSLVSAMLDGLLCTVSLGAALAALRLTGSVWLTVWAFFLPQALSACIPRRFEPAAATPTPPSDAFARAHQAAEEALRRLARQAAG